jgi:hypothetical protein
MPLKAHFLPSLLCPEDGWGKPRPGVSKGGKMVASFQQHSRGRKLQGFMKISELLECNVPSLIQQNVPGCTWIGFAWHESGLAK